MAKKEEKKPSEKKAKGFPPAEADEKKDAPTVQDSKEKSDGEKSGSEPAPESTQDEPSKTTADAGKETPTEAEKPSETDAEKPAEADGEPPAEKEESKAH